jgi:hypothetical protein
MLQGDVPTEDVCFINHAIADWDVSNVTNMDYMFK